MERKQLRIRERLDEPEPTPAGANLDERGRFAKGNKLGRGNPLAVQAQKLRFALMGAVTPEQLVSVIDAMLKKALKGDIAAANVLMTRLLGPPVQADILEQLEELRAAIEELKSERRVNGFGTPVYR